MGLHVFNQLGIGPAKSQGVLMPIRVAVMIVGLNRSLEFTVPSILNEIITPLDTSRLFALSCRIVLIYPKEGVQNPRTNEKGKVSKDVPDSLGLCPVTLLDQELLAEDTRALSDELANRGDTWGDNAQSVRNAITFLTGLRESWELVPHSADIIIFTRPDVSIERPLKVKRHVFMVWLLSKLGLLSIRIPSWGGWRSKKGINDRFMIACRPAAERYFLRLNQLPDALSDDETFYTGTFLRYALKGLFLQRVIHSPMVRVRMGGVREVRDLGRLEPKDYRSVLGRKFRRAIRSIKSQTNASRSG